MKRVTLTYLFDIVVNFMLVHLYFIVWSGVLICEESFSSSKLCKT